MRLPYLRMRTGSLHYLCARGTQLYFTEMQTDSLVDIYLKFHVLFYTGISLGLELCKIEITLSAPSSN